MTRTGSTMLQRLLGTVPLFDSPMTWEVMVPSPAGRPNNWKKSQRFQQAKERLGLPPFSFFFSFLESRVAIDHDPISMHTSGRRTVSHRQLCRRRPDIGPVMSWPLATSMESARNWANAGLALPQHASPTLAQC